ncbi:MAG TPA: tail fiber domain-containing protein [Pyrinomonadaceae bacterium]|nr:tail fiber domain-containing protein [Pyrinomonadaceae bacterium]
MRSINTVLVVIILAVGISAQTSTFIYQGSLNNGSNPANGNYDLEFRMYDAVSGGAQQGATLQRLNVAVADGSFAVSLDFGAAVLPGTDRFLDISVRTAGGGAFTPLAPRQRITSTPYSIKSANSASADSLSVSCVGCITASQISGVNGSAVSGAIPVASVPSGSGNYIQNTTSPQASSNFNISGTGSAANLNASVVTATGQFNLSGNRILSATPGNNLFVGIDAGPSTTGPSNAFVGRRSGFGNTSGAFNAFFGTDAGSGNTSGTYNSFFGSIAGNGNTTGNRNTVIGYAADVGSGSLSYATAVGAESTVSTSNTIALGRTSGADTVRAYGDLTADNLVSANRFDSSTQYNIGGQRILGNPGSGNLFAGIGAGSANTTGSNNSLLGRAAGSGNSTGGNNTFVGHTAGDANTTGSFNTAIGQNADVGSGNLSHATAIGADAVVTASNTIVVGRASGADSVLIPGHVRVTNTLSTDSTLATQSFLFVRELSAGTIALCYDVSNRLLATCSSSVRYKTDINPFTQGTALLDRLRPVTYKWKVSGEPDLGLIAEEVAEVEPLLATYDKDGRVQGVKYEQLTIVLINALKEQQAQINELKRQLCLMQATSGCSKQRP